MRATCLSWAASITVTVPPSLPGPALSTHRYRPSCCNATRDGCGPASTFASTFHEAVLTTATFPAAGMLTNRRVPSRLATQSSPGAWRSTRVSSLLLQAPDRVQHRDGRLVVEGEDV